MEAQFRIGGHYRQRNGAVVQVMGEGPYKGINGHFYPGGRILQIDQGGQRNINGACCNLAGTGLADLDLLPCELHQVNGEWLPLGVAQEAPKPASEPTRPRLTWADSKRPDPFDGFIVTSSTTQQDKAGHPLQRITAESDPRNGSAFLRD